MIARTERFEMRLDQSELARVDEWRARQPDLPSRAEAFRRLVEAGLGASGDRQIRLSDGEKLILVMLCGIYKHQDIHGEADPDLVLASIFDGHSWGLDWGINGLFHDEEDSPRTVQEVGQILEMWWTIELAYEGFSAEEKEQINDEDLLFKSDVSFPGFDGNEESEHCSVAKFMVDGLGRFSDFKGRSLNSHHPTLEGYRRMLQVYRPIQAEVRGRISVRQVIDLLRAFEHPG